MSRRGVLRVDQGLSTQRGHPADTFLDMTGWGKGLLWINGFNVGWYWPLLGPQMTTYIPGPLLRLGDNAIVLLEFAQEATNRTGAQLASTILSTACHFHTFCSSDGACMQACKHTQPQRFELLCPGREAALKCVYCVSQ
jgi:hypothetical protein